jgi:hypothetical protein
LGTADFIRVLAPANDDVESGMEASGLAAAAAAERGL